MATESYRRQPDPVAENNQARDVNADIEKALKDRIAEYKACGRDTEYMEEKLKRLINAKKGRRKSVDDAPVPDRDDSTEGVTAAEEERVKRESGEAAPADPPGVPDQESDKDEDQTGNGSSVPEQVSPDPVLPTEPAIKQPPVPASTDAAIQQGSSQDTEAIKARAARSTSGTSGNKRSSASDKK